MRTSEQIKTEIEEKFGFFPPFFNQAQPAPQVLENLWQQTLSAYVDNPLPTLFKEKLSAYLSRYCDIAYCLVCHSCTLYSLGMKAREIWELLELPSPMETDIEKHLEVLAHSPEMLSVPSSNAELEECIFYCTICIFLEGSQAERCRRELHRLLGSVNYQYLVSLIAYVKTCHLWMEAHPDLAYEADKRVRDNMDDLVDEEPRLAEFFDNYSEKVKCDRQSRAEQQTEEALQRARTAEANNQELEQEIIRRSQAEEALRESEERFRALVEHAADAFFLHDLEGRLIDVNHRACESLGYTREELLNLSVPDFEINFTSEEFAPRWKQLARGEAIALNGVHQRKDGTTFPVEVSIGLLELGSQQFILALARDITERKQAQEKLERTLSLLRATLDSTADGILVTEKGKIVSFNRKFVEMWRLPESVVVSQAEEQALEFVRDQLKYPECFLAKVRELYGQPEAKSLDVIEFKDGRFFERYSQPQKVGENHVGRVWSFRDITERKQAEKQLLHETLHDKLTGLPNRTLFMDRLRHAIARSKRHTDYSFAVLFLDLDRFKVVNDSLGHMVGDQLLNAIADRLRTCLRDEDTIARIGGDEFTILLEDIEDTSDATHVAKHIQQELTLPFHLGGHELGGHEVFTAASIGIALSDPSGSPCYERPEELLRDADTTMYRAKVSGNAGIEVFNPTMHTQAVALLQLETDLRRAIERQEFRIHYQPLVSLSGNRIIGFEALLRWQHPERGLISPAEFMPVAEETELIVPIGWWLLREACRQMQTWQEQFQDNPPLTMSVNFSGKQFLQPGLIEQIDQLLQETALDPKSLQLEITETMLMENTEAATATLEQMSALNPQLYIDDFGTGYSSLSYLHRLPIDGLKIDHSFVSRMDVDSDNLEIVRVIATLAHNLGMDVIAEGVETIEQLAQLKALNCKYGQGNFFSKPITNKAAKGLIAMEPQW